MNDARAQQRDPQTYAIIGAGMEVHAQLGPGFSEVVYADALEMEFRLRGIPYAREVEIPIYYKGQRLPSHFRADFVCYGVVIVELKALGGLSGVERAQVINYLKATRFERGLLLNFGAVSLEYERLVLTRRTESV